MANITRSISAITLIIGLLIAPTYSTAANEPETVATVLDTFTFPAPESRCPSFSDAWKKARNYPEFYDVSTAEAKQLGTCLTQEAQFNMRALSQLLSKEQLIVEALDTTSWPGWDTRPKIMRAKWNNNCDRNIACMRKFLALQKQFKKLRSEVHSIAKKHHQLFLDQFELVVAKAIIPNMKKNAPEYFEKSGIAEHLKSMSSIMKDNSRYDFSTD